ncbi:hypothetical protein U91I_01720 [alpha proteobacterium U9-1i]|nr:hypothetical protein U91I_01720 [alpha proteobacterium U9-1i]
MVPLDPEKQIPYEKRKRLVRREFVELMRNKLGAHLDEEIPELLDALQRSESFGVDVEWRVPTGVVSIGAGTLPVVVGPAAAMMRKISQELIDAYTDLAN